MKRSKTKAETHIKEFYPHLKITDEPFPRLLVTRKFLKPNDEYFGAYLPPTALRIFFYRLIEIFRLRGCTIDIDGKFSLPCQLFFTRKCVAPCVEKICSPEEYADLAKALKLFLANDDRVFEKFVIEQIDGFSEKFEFEKAARWRDIWRDSQVLKADKTVEINLANAADTFSFEETEEFFIVNLITTRGRKFLGGREFAFSKTDETSIGAVLEKILDEFYRFHAPREIRLPAETANRKIFEKRFRAEFNPKTKISVIKNELNPTARFRFKRTKMESYLETIQNSVPLAETKKTFKKIFKIKQTPQTVEVFDVAHISNEDFIAASAVWENGEFKKEKAKFWKVDAANEPQAMAEGVSERIKTGDLPDLILVDGGKGQINAVLKILEQNGLRQTAVGGIVKPPGKHNSVSHFLNPDGAKTVFIEGDKTLEILRRLRDEAHLTANEIHRQYRDNKYIFAAGGGDAEFSEMIPSVIVRYDEEGGAAEDLQPLKTLKINRR